MKKKISAAEQHVTDKLGEMGIEVVEFKSDGDKCAVQGNMLQPVQIDKDTYYVNVPVSVMVKVDENGEVEKTEVENQENQQRSAEQFVKMLVDNNKLYGFREKFPHGATHMIEENDKGQLVIKRRGFSVR